MMHAEQLARLEGQIDAIMMRATRSVDISRVLKLSFGRVLLNDIRKNGKAQFALMMASRALPHIADWLEASLINNASWLHKLDELDRPKKLMKFHSIAQITAEADKAILKASQKVVDLKKDVEQIRHLEDLGRGYSVVQLLTPESLDEESRMLRHCIGGGAYDWKLSASNYQLLSIRDKGGNPVATIELAAHPTAKKAFEVIQIQGFKNTPVSLTHMDMIVDYFQNIGVIPKNGTATSRLPYIVDRHGKWHCLFKLPEILEACSFIVSIDNRIIFTLPKVLIGSDIIDMQGVHADFFPSLEESKSLSLRISDSRIRNMPTTLETDSSIHVTDTDIYQMPKSIIADLLFCNNLNALNWPDLIDATKAIILMNCSAPSKLLKMKSGEVISIQKIESLSNYDIESPNFIGSEISFASKPRSMIADSNKITFKSP